MAGKNHRSDELNSIGYVLVLGDSGVEVPTCWKALSLGRNHLHEPDSIRGL